MLSLIGVLIIVVGFMLKIDTLAVVVAAGIATGFVGSLNFNEILQTLGEAFVSNRFMSIFIITLPVIGLMERYGLKERAAWVIGQLKNAKAEGVLSLYLIARVILAALSVRMQGHVQFVRPLVLPMAEGAVKANYDNVDDKNLEELKGLAAAAENYGNFFGQNLFIGSAGVMLVIGTLNELGYPVDARQGPIRIALTTIPIAIIAIILGALQFRIHEKRMAEASKAVKAKEGEQL